MYQKKIGSEGNGGERSGAISDVLPVPGSMTGKFLTAFFMLTMTVSAGLTLYIVAVPHQGEPFTEFYLLGPDGKADHYPAVFGPGEQKSVRAGIVNHENTYKDYDLLVVLSDGNATTTLYEEKIGLGDGRTWEKPVVLRPDRAGPEMRIEFLLYEDDDRSVPYRDLYLRANVTG